jgi:hypothetical protein
MPLLLCSSKGELVHLFFFLLIPQERKRSAHYSCRKNYTGHLSPNHYRERVELELWFAAFRPEIQWQNQAGNRLVAASAVPAATTAASFASLVTVPAEHRSVASRFKRHRSRLATPRADYGCTLRRSGTKAGTPLARLLCHTACLAALGGRVTAFLEKCLIGSCKDEILSTIATSELNVFGHGSPSMDVRIVQSIRHFAH